MIWRGPAADKGVAAGLGRVGAPLTEDVSQVSTESVHSCSPATSSGRGICHIDPTEIGTVGVVVNTNPTWRVEGNARAVAGDDTAAGVLDAHQEICTRSDADVGRDQ